MTASRRTRPSEVRPAAGRVFVAFAAVLTVIVVGMLSLFAVPASASTLAGAQNAVGAIHAPAGQRVGPHEGVLAGQGRARAPNYDRSVVGSGVGAEDESGSLSTGARDAPVVETQPGETFVRVGATPENLNFTFETPGGVRAGTYAFPESTFNEIGLDPAALKNLGDLPGEPPSVYRLLEPPAGTPIQWGVVPGGEFGGDGGVPEVFFPEGF